MAPYRVLEFGSYLCGPLLGKHLAQAGCAVTTVLRPSTSSGFHREASAMAAMNSELRRGKHCVELDLPKDTAKLQQLLAETDVVIENFGPGVAQKLGFDAASVHACNSRIIHLSLPGFASSDPETRDCLAWESVLLACSGVFSEMGLNRTLLGVEASFSTLPMASVYASIFGFYALMTALYAERWGSSLEVPLASALSEALVHNSIKFPLERCYMNARKRAIEDGKIPLLPSELTELFDPFFNKYTCGDGRPIYLVCPAHIEHQRRTIRSLGIEHAVLEHIQPVDMWTSDSYTSGLGCGSLDDEQAQLVRPLIAKAFLKKGAFEWETILGKASVPAVAHRTTEEWMSSDHARDSGLVRDDPTEDRIAPVGWLRSPQHCSSKSSDACGVHMEGREASAPLHGVRVIDLTNVIAGPTAGAMLARLGADVIKVDPPRPSYAPDIAVIYGLAANLGKRSILVDIFDPNGRTVLEKLLSTADVLLVNCTEECLIRARITRADLRKINPRLILAQFDAWGGPIDAGSMRNNIGYDDNVQAAIGIMARFGGSLETSEEHAHIGTIDVIGGVAFAALVVRALIARKKDGTVYTARSSLAAVGQYLQFTHMMGVANLTVGKGVRCRGEHPLNCCYCSSNREWILICTPVADEHSWSELSRSFGIPMRTYEEVRTVFSRLCANDIIDRCREANIAAIRLRKMSQIRTQYTMSTNHLTGATYQFRLHTDHPIGPLCIVAPVAIRGLFLAPESHAPKYGQHTCEILNEINHRWPTFSFSGLSFAWSHNYLPFATKCDKCLQGGRHLTVLSCEHKICNTCRFKAQDACSICGRTHNLNTESLRDNIASWKQEYRMWRSGEEHGASDIEKVCYPLRMDGLKKSRSLGTLQHA